MFLDSLSSELGLTFCLPKFLICMKELLGQNTALDGSEQLCEWTRNCFDFFLTFSQPLLHLGDIMNGDRHFKLYELEFNHLLCCAPADV